MSRASVIVAGLICGAVAMACSASPAAPAPADGSISATEAPAKQTTGAVGTFLATEPMGNRRSFHVAVLLNDGNVLIAAGTGEATGRWAPPHETAEIYDPATGIWSFTGDLAKGREDPIATLLSDGRVLVVGGGDVRNDPVKNADIYDPATGEWMPAGRTKDPRLGHTVVTLADGTVMVAGGWNDFLRVLETVEIYDPDTEKWIAVSDMSVPRALHSATVLKDGRVLVAGGGKMGSAGTRMGAEGPFLETAEMYDPATGEWSATGSMAEGRAVHTATLLDDGTVLVIGGGSTLATAEIYDPATGTWSAAGNLGEGRVLHTATLLGDGRVLVTGSLGSVATAELYDPVSNTWSSAGSMTEGRYQHSATLLKDGSILIVGGQAESLLRSTELYTP